MRPTLSADGIPIANRAEGAGEPAVVFVHCWCGNQGFWKGAVAALKDRHRVVTLDLAGHGASGRGRARYTVEAFAQDVKAVVEKLGLTKVILVGHSMGGPVTLEAARLMPDRVVKLIPIDTFHNVEEVWPEEQRAAFLKPFEEDFRVAVRTFVPQLMPPGTDPAVVKRVVDAMAACDPAMGVSAMRALIGLPGGRADRDREGADPRDQRRPVPDRPRREPAARAAVRGHGDEGDGALPDVRASGGVRRGPGGGVGAE